MTTPTKPNHGGRRPGAGPKTIDPSGVKMIVVPVRMTPAQRDKYRAMPDGPDRLRAWVDRAR
jgi:hypothetical protein